MTRALILAVSIFTLAGCNTSSQINASSKEEASKPSANRVRAECPNFKDVAVKQQTPVWCWAASAEMVHKYYGENTITQEQLAKEITNASGSDPKKARAAGLQEIMVALNPDIRKERLSRGESMAVERIRSGSTAAPTVDVVDVALGQTAPWSASSDDLVDAVASQNPAIVGLRGEGRSMGHAVVVYATSYEPVKVSEGKSFGNALFGAVAKEAGNRHGIRDDQVDAAGVTKAPAKFKLSEIEYVDPMDGKRYKLNAEGFKNRVDFIMTKARAREILDRQTNAVH
jgi:hypothetical protein